MALNATMPGTRVLACFTSAKVLALLVLTTCNGMLALLALITCFTSANDKQRQSTTPTSAKQVKALPAAFQAPRLFPSALPFASCSPRVRYSFSGSKSLG